MNSEQKIVSFLRDPICMAKYRQAMNLLSEVPFEELLRSVGEPKHIAPDEPYAMQMLTLESAERKGWYDALNHVFNLVEIVEPSLQDRPGTLDFGAEDALRARGYTEEELKD